MLMVLAQLSGDLEILDEVTPYIHGAWSFLESVPDNLKQKVRARLAGVLKDYAASSREPPRHILSEVLKKMIRAIRGVWGDGDPRDGNLEVATTHQFRFIGWPVRGGGQFGFTERQTTRSRIVCGDGTVSRNEGRSSRRAV